MKKSAVLSNSRRHVVAVAFPTITETELAVLDGIREAVGPGQQWEILVLTRGDSTPTGRNEGACGSYR